MKKFYFLTMFFAFVGIGQVWANTAKIEGEQWKANRAWSGPHATFTLDAPNATYDGMWKELDIKADQVNVITWTVDPGCSIEITAIKFRIGSSSTKNRSLVVNGEAVEKVGFTTGSDYGPYTGYSLGVDDSIKFTITKDIDLYYIELTYTITPDKPGAPHATETINVTLDPANLEENAQQTVDFGIGEAFAESIEFEVTPNNGSAHKNGSFYATVAGEFKAKARIAAKADCHEASDWSDEVTITVNRLDQTLSWTDEKLINTNMIIGSKQTIEATSTSGRAVTYKSSNPSVLHVNANGELTANAEGEATITASRDQDDQYNAAVSISKDFKVRLKDTPHFVPSEEFVTEDSCAVRLQETASIELSYVSDGLDGDFTAVPADGEIITVARDGKTLTITAEKVGTTTLTLSQKENASFNAVSKTYKIEVLRLIPTIWVNEATEFAPVLSLGAELSVSFTSDNNESDDFALEQLSGAEIAVIEENKIIAKYTAGTASWKVSLPQTANYEAAELIFSATVKPAEEEVCYVAKDESEHSMYGVFSASADMFEIKWENGFGDKLYFEAKRAGIDGLAGIAIYLRLGDNTDFEAEKWTWFGDGEGLHSSYDHVFEFQFDQPNVTGIRFKGEGSATQSKHVRNIYVTRRTYLEAEEVNLELFPNEAGEATLNVDYSIANGGDLKLVCDNELFTLDENTINVSDCSDGKAAIPVHFAAQTEQKTYTTNVVIYNGVYSKSVKLSAEVRKLNPIITAEDVELVYGEQTPLAAEVDVDTLALNYELAAETDVISLVDGQIFALKPGEAQVRAFTAETAQYNPAEKIITVAVSKASQTITWDQALDNMELDQELQLEATASSELAVIFESSDPTIASIDENNVLRALSVGEVTITAKQEGDANYEAAEPIQKSFNVTKIAQQIIWPVESDTIVLPLNAEELIYVTATSGLEVDLTSSDPTVVKIVGANYDEHDVYIGHLVMALKEGESIVTANEYGDDRYEAAEQVWKVIVVKISPTGFENLFVPDQTVKVIRDGQIFILRDGQVYSIQGYRVE